MLLRQAGPEIEAQSTLMRDFKGLPSRAARPLAWVMLSFYLIACPVLAQSLEVIDLKYRTAAEVIPVLQPLLEQGGALTGQDYKLFVRASAANVSQLRAALAQIDRQPNQLLVSVRRSTQQEVEDERARASGTLSNRGSSVTVQATDNNARDRSDGVASVQVIEGNSAFISSGSDVPIVTAVAAGVGRRRAWAAATTEYRNVSSGFVVTPRVNGQAVVLDIEQQDERVVNGAVQTQHLTTQVSGTLGEWIQLGGVSETGSTQQRGILSRQYTTSSDERSIWVKVSTH
jgi:Bacterial type II/III secretion system short domain